MATMQPVPELGIPEVKPAIEAIRGRWVQKVSPRRKHNILQVRLGMLLTQWAGERGEVGSEYRFYLLEQGRTPSSFVPDVAYYSFERMPKELGDARERPTMAPDLAVEILSPDDRRAILDEKISMYLANGCRLAIVVDPEARSVQLHEQGTKRTFSSPDIAACSAFGDLRLDTKALFDTL